MLIPNGFTRLSTSPILLALLDLIFFPVSIISRASGSPTWRNHDNYQNKKNSIAIMFVLVPGLKISMSHSTTQFIWLDINQKSWQACTCWPLLWKSTTTCVQFFSFKMIANGIWSVRSCLNAGRTLLDMSKLKHTSTWVACATDGAKLLLTVSPSAKQHQHPCSGSLPVYQDLNMYHDWPVKI